MGHADLSAAEAPLVHALQLSPSGLLLVIDPARLRIVGASANADEQVWIPAADFLGRDLREFFDEASVDQLQSLLSVLDATSPRARRFARLTLRHGQFSLEAVKAVVYLGGECLCIELEVQSSRRISEWTLSIGFLDLANAIAAYLGDVEALPATVCGALREVTGFEDVCYWAIDAGGAAACVMHAGSGSCCPGEGMVLPPALREALLLNRFAAIGDASSGTVSLVQLPEAVRIPVDYALSHLREFDPARREALRARGVAAEAIFGVVRKGLLVGAFIATHPSPRHLSYAELSLCQTLVEIFRNRTKALRQAEDIAMRRDKDEVLHALFESSGEIAFDPATFAARNHADIAWLLRADDFVCRLDGHVYHGRTLPAADALELLEHAGMQLWGARAYATHALDADAPDLRCAAEVRSVYALALDEHADNVFAWLRGDADVAPGLPAPAWTDVERDVAAEFAHGVAQALAAYLQAQARRTAETANRMKSEFLANISHELRSPMHSIIGLSDALAEKSATLPPERIRLFAETIRASGERLLALINDLLDLSKLEAGKMSFEFAAAEAGAIVDLAVRETAAMAAKRSVSLRVEHGAAGRQVRVDRNRVVQVLINLLSNAIKFSPEGAEVVVRCADDADGDAPAVLLEVADRGIGIPDGEVESIFEKFIQSSRSKTGAGGTGLGLSICREIVAAHGGRIWARNNPGGGSTFALRLPAAAAAPASTDPGEQP